MENNQVSLEDMIEELTNYYEAAGFRNVYEIVLKHKTEEEIRDMYKNEIEDICTELF